MENTILDVIKKEIARQKLSFRKVSELAFKNPNTLIGVFRGCNPTIRSITKICRVLGLDLSIEPSRNLVSKPSPSVDEPAAEHVLIPKLDISLSAGRGSLAPTYGEEASATSMLAFRRDWMEAYGLQPGAVSAVEVKGDSMEPVLKERDTILVDHRRQELKQGRIVAVRGHDELFVKRLEKNNKKQWLLTSENKQYSPINVTAKHVIIGEIVWRGTWLGEPVPSKQQMAILLKKINQLAEHRVQCGHSKNFAAAIKEIEAEMARDGIFDDDEA